MKMLLCNICVKGFVKSKYYKLNYDYWNIQLLLISTRVAVANVDSSAVSLTARGRGRFFGRLELGTAPAGDRFISSGQNYELLSQMFQEQEKPFISKMGAAGAKY